MKKIFPALLILFVSFPLQAESVSKNIQKIEKRRGLWINLESRVKMNFKSQGGKSASCDADLLYDRLNEKILLKGFNALKKLLFAFRTDDRDFRLYLSSANTDFSGSIFDLEDSPAIHSHLKALDLYRALKPSAIPQNAKIETRPDGGMRIEVAGKTGLERELFASPAGDILKEIYYRKDGNVKAIIERGEFKPVWKGKKESFYFPEKILVRNFYSPPGTPGAESQTELVFLTAKFSPAADPSSFEFQPPEGVRQVDVGEEFRKQQALASN